MAEKPILGLRRGESILGYRDPKYLHQILNASNLLERRPTDIDGIRQDLINVTGAEIPMKFLFDTGLVDLTWQLIYHPNAMSAVYLGVKNKRSPDIQLSDSEGIIVINSEIDGQKIKTDIVELSTVVPDSQGRSRALTVKYNGRTLEAVRGAVSIADDEKPKFSRYSHPDNQKESDDQLLEIPFVINHGYLMPNTALVSKTIHLLANQDTKMVESYQHMNRYWIMLSNGFFEGQQGEDRVIGLGKNPSEFSWKVSFPDKLVPAKK